MNGVYKANALRKFKMLVGTKIIYTDYPEKVLSSRDGSTKVLDSNALLLDAVKIVSAIKDSTLLIPTLDNVMKFLDHRESEVCFWVPFLVKPYRISTRKGTNKKRKIKIL